MVQLTPDHLAFGEELLRVDVLLERFSRQIPVVAGIETVALRHAAQRVLAEDVEAPLPLPGFANSAVDGYAVAHAMLNPDRDTVLPVIGRVAAGARALFKTRRLELLIPVEQGRPRRGKAET